MFRVAAAQIGTDVLVAAAPKTRKVARDLHWPVCWGQQLDDQGHTTTGNCRMHCQAEQFLHANRELRSLLRRIVDGHLRAGGRVEMRWRFSIKALAQIPR